MAGLARPTSRSSGSTAVQYAGGTTVNNAVLEVANVGGPYTNVLPATTVLNLVNNGVFDIDAQASARPLRA